MNKDLLTHFCQEQGGQFAGFLGRGIKPSGRSKPDACKLHLDLMCFGGHECDQKFARTESEGLSRWDLDLSFVLSVIKAIRGSIQRVVPSNLDFSWLRLVFVLIGQRGERLRQEGQREDHCSHLGSRSRQVRPRQ